MFRYSSQYRIALFNASYKYTLNHYWIMTSLLVITRRWGQSFTKGPHYGERGPSGAAHQLCDVVSLQIGHLKSGEVVSM